MRSPLVAFPGSDIARKGDAASKSTMIATPRVWFISTSIGLVHFCGEARAKRNLGQEPEHVIGHLLASSVRRGEV
jgi:hypothetical protein